jgi:hypothetical protein
MALVPQLIDVPFEGGLDTNTDKKKVLPAKLLELENAVFDGSSIAIRPGGSFLEDGVAAGGPALDTARALSVVGGELLRWADEGVYGRSSASAPWVQRGDAVDANPLSYAVQSIAQRPKSCEGYDVASLGGVTVYVWTEALDAISGGPSRSIRATVVDDATGTRLQDAVALATFAGDTSGAAAQVRALVCGSCIVVLYGVFEVGTTSRVYARVLLPTDPDTFLTATSIAAAANRSAVNYPFEFAGVEVSASGASTGTFALAYGNTTSGVTLQRYTVTALGVVASLGASASVTPITGGTASSPIHLNLVANTARTRLYLLFYNVDTGHTELHTRYASDLATLSAADLDTFTMMPRITAAEVGSTGVITGYFEPSPATAPVHTASWDTDGTVTVAMTPWVRNVRLAGRVFDMDGTRYVPCFYLDQSTTTALPGIQPSFLLLEADSKRVALRAFTGDCAGPIAGAPSLPRVLTTQGAVALVVPRRLRAEFQEFTGIVYDVSSAGLFRLDVAPADPATLFRIEESGALRIGGAAPAMYDGESWVEDGFHVQPEGVTVSLSGGGGLAAGTYSWVFCYEWMDALGRLHRSAPSVPVTATATAGQQASLVVPLLHLTRKSGVRLAAYRTQADGVVFYRTGRSTDAYVQPDTLTTNTVTLLEGASDTSIADNEVLPFGGASGGSVGGELWHRPPPGYATAHKHQDYILTTVMDDPYAVAYTLPLTKGEGPAWADELRLYVPSAQGPVVALATLDDKLVILCERGAWAVLGRGPTRDGGNNGFSEPQYITGSVGCLSAASVISSPDGLMYQSSNGIYLLSRGLETVKLGAGVQEYSGQTVARALDVPARRELRWYTQDGRTLVYSLEWRQWSTWTGQPTRDALLFRDVVHYADGERVRYEDASSILEGGAPFSVVVGTSWLKFSGFSGLQRVWKFLLLGDAEVTHTLKSEVFTDYRTTASQTKTATFPGSSVGGPKVLRVRQTIEDQLCSAIRFRWTLTPTPTGPTDSGKLGLTSLTLEVGAHRGTAKRRVSNL